MSVRLKIALTIVATGLITAAGVYTAPATVQTVTVRGVSTADATKFGSATVTVKPLRRALRRRICQSKSTFRTSVCCASNAA